MRYPERTPIRDHKTHPMGFHASNLCTSHEPPIKTFAVPVRDTALALCQGPHLGPCHGRSHPCIPLPSDPQNTRISRTAEPHTHATNASSIRAKGAPTGTGCPQPAHQAITPKSQARNCSSGYMEQARSRGHEASPQSGLGVGCKMCSSSKKAARAECTCAGVAQKHRAG